MSWFLNYETRAKAQAVSDALNASAEQVRKGQGLSIMNIDGYDYSVGDALKMSDQVTGEWAGVYRTARPEANQ